MKKMDPLISVSFSISISITLSLKNTQKTSVPLKWDYTIHCNENKNGNENLLDNDKSGINRPRSRHGPKYSKYNVSR